MANADDIGDALTLLAVGDWGGGSNARPTTPNQLSVAASMRAAARLKRPDAVMMMGDNFYLRGLSCDDNPSAGYDYVELEAARFDVVVASFEVVSDVTISEAAFLRNVSEGLASDLSRQLTEPVTSANIKDVRRTVSGLSPAASQIELNLVIRRQDPASRQPETLRQALNRVLEDSAAAQAQQTSSGQRAGEALSAALDAWFGLSAWQLRGATARVGTVESRPCNQKFSTRFNQTFESVYDGPGLEGVPFYALSGNHDYYGWVRAQIAYANDPPTGATGRWRYPASDPRPSLADGSVEAPFYTFDLRRERDGLSVLVVMTDSVKWASLCSPYRGSLVRMRS